MIVVPIITHNEQSIFITCVGCNGNYLEALGQSIQILFLMQLSFDRSRDNPRKTK